MINVQTKVVTAALILLCNICNMAYCRVFLRAECKTTALEDVHVIDFFWADSVKQIKQGSIPDAELRLFPINTKDRGPQVIPTFLEQGADMILRQSWMSKFEVSLWSPDGQILHSDILPVDVIGLCKIKQPAPDAS